jgi:signal transduction histidine kinase
MLQDRLDRRFNRRSYDARRVVSAGLGVERAGIDIEALLREATGDAELTVGFPGPDGTWLSAHGTPADAVEAAVEIARRGRVVARIGYDPERVGEASVRDVAELAAGELDNTRLRSELAAKVAEVEESRLRIARAQRDERRRIERDLHDGAQQSLLALAFRLQAAALNGNPVTWQAALRDGATDAGAAARELRALANGLHPQALTEGGLPAVLDDVARSSPVPVKVSADVDRVDPAVEFTAWLVIAEAVVNAQKHSGADLISIDVTIDVSRDQRLLRFRVADDGRGGADTTSDGLLGLLDRVEAARGVVSVTTGADGTVIEGALPCVS